MDINSTNSAHASVSVLKKLCTNTLVHSARTIYMLLNLATNLDMKLS